MLSLCLDTAKGRGPTNKFTPGPLAGLEAPAPALGNIAIRLLAAAPLTIQMGNSG